MEGFEKIISREMKILPHSIKRIGGGYYADVYKTDLTDGKTVIIKAYKTSGVMEDEILQLDILSRYALYPMPSVLFSHKASEEYNKDFIVMSYLSGKNAGNIFYLNPSKRKQLADQITDNLIAFHSTKSTDGFGETGSNIRYSTFNEYYKNRAQSILKMACTLKEKGDLDNSVYKTMLCAVNNFDKIFYLPIVEASLIHGDYNTWNILADKKDCKVTAVIDPCGCMWADKEYDLYQLNNANGRHLGLFENYASKVHLSENYKEKMAFYELFTEIEHYYKSGYPVVKKLVKKQANQLNTYLEKLI